MSRVQFPCLDDVEVGAAVGRRTWAWPWPRVDNVEVDVAVGPRAWP